MKKLALAILLLGLTCSCGSNSSSSASLITVTINPATPSNIDQGQTSQFTARLRGDTANQGVTWSLAGPGCAGATCGTLSNVTPTSATYSAPATISADMSVTVTATSVAAPSQFGTTSFFVMPPPSIVTTSLPVATPNQAYYTTIQASGGVLPLNWSVTSGALPAGLYLNSAGEIQGTPTSGGTANFTLKVIDSSGSPAGTLSAQQALGLTVVGILTVPQGTLPAGVEGLASPCGGS